MANIMSAGSSGKRGEGEWGRTVFVGGHVWLKRSSSAINFE